MNFLILKTAIAAKFEQMQKHQLFRVNLEKDALWEAYINSFPVESNPIFRKRTEHECSCCKQFIRSIGDCVAIIDGKIVSIWDVDVSKEPGYQIVVDTMSALVHSKSIGDHFLHYELRVGKDQTFEEIMGNIKTWNHFSVNIKRDFVLPNKDIATKLSESRSTHDVFLRALKELTMDSINTVLELIGQNSLLRGEQNKFAVSEFKKLKTQFDKLATDQEKDIFAWTASKNISGAITDIRSSSIGSLLVDLSKGEDLQGSVASYENKVHGSTYQRPTALVTTGMIEDAKNKLQSLNMTSALNRRFATIDDISINNILFVDRTSTKAIGSDVFDEIASTAKTKKQNFDKVEEVHISKFIADILPTAKSLEIMMQRDHVNNLVSLIAPSDPTSENMFKWNNKFSWSYNGEVADSIKERVKKAGGNVTGDFCNRLAWFNYDDLDFHMIEPDGRYEIYFGNRTSTSPCGGRLDVDMNAGSGSTREPVENIFYADHRKMKKGVYTLIVHQYSKRETQDVGFEVEMDFMGTTYHFSYPKSLSTGSKIEVAKIKYSGGDTIEILESLPSTSSISSTLAWNVPTNKFHEVEAVMLSPNFWEGFEGGNKHYFFMLKNCVNDGTARGFYNEFLKEELKPHRKVFEILGSKTKVEESTNQLSGLGFSSTQQNTLLCKVTGSFTRVIKLVF